MIRFVDVHKSYRVDGRDIPALQPFSLEIADGEVFGIIGLSGAGKSTLIRLINLLERPSGGNIFINNVEMTALAEPALRVQRRKIGMIFQHFNLLASQTVADNVAFPLRLAGERNADALRQRVDELLARVGLTAHAGKYPSQLSGGQKQRVGIARALANRPSILRCDEATSALDPQTTASVLELLAEINRELKLTIVLITHEMDVIRRVCDQVAVMDAGVIVEQGPVADVFLHPKHATTRRFVNEALPEGSSQRAGAICPGTWTHPATELSRRYHADARAGPRCPRDRDRLQHPRRPHRPYQGSALRPAHPCDAGRTGGCRADRLARSRYRNRGAAPMNLLQTLFPNIDDWGELGHACIDTLLMLGGSLLLTVLIGLPLGVLLYLTGKGQLRPMPKLYAITSLLVNILRSVPFIILMIVLMPATYFLVGTKLGIRGAIPPLVIGAAPFFARLVETALREVQQGVIEASQAMGASLWQIVRHVLLPEARGGLFAGITVTAIALVGYTAMGGAIGSGGLGDLAYRYGYLSYKSDYMLVTVVLLIVLVQLLQMIGDRIVTRYKQR